MRNKLIPLLLILLFVLAACGSNATQTTTQAATAAPTCRSTLPANLPTTAAPPPTKPHKMNMGPHMKMTAYRPATAQDMARVEAIVQNAHACFDKYRDYHLALRDGYRIFAPDVAQGGYQFVGVMYSAPANDTEDQLNQFIPLSITPWHLHTNICLPAGDTSTFLFPNNSLFGLTGTIATKAQCDKLGGTFYSSLFGWMVHIPLFGSVSAG